MSDTPLFDNIQDRHEGQQRAERGQEQAARANAAAVATIGGAFLSHLRAIRPEPGSLDTLRASGFELPAMTSVNTIGAAIGRLSRAGLIQCVGVTRGSRVAAHRAKIYLWRLSEDMGGATAGEGGL